MKTFFAALCLTVAVQPAWSSFETDARQALPDLSVEAMQQEKKPSQPAYKPWDGQGFSFPKIRVVSRLWQGAVNKIVILRTGKGDEKLDQSATLGRFSSYTAEYQNSPEEKVTDFRNVSLAKDTESLKLFPYQRDGGLGRRLHLPWNKAPRWKHWMEPVLKFVISDNEIKSRHYFYFTIMPEQLINAPVNSSTELDMALEDPLLYDQESDTMIKGKTLQVRAKIIKQADQITIEIR